jgi:hypothetical protein
MLVRRLARLVCRSALKSVLDVRGYREGHSFSLDNILKLKKEKEATSAMAWSPDSLRLAAGTTLGELLVRKHEFG